MDENGDRYYEFGEMNLFHEHHRRNSKQKKYLQIYRGTDYGRGTENHSGSRNERLQLSQRQGGFNMNIAQKYVDGLKKAYYEKGGEKQWNHFERVMHGASEEDIEKLRGLYPDVPDSLLQLLEIVDGTYWREYDKEEVALFFLGSDMEEYPYYLLSVKQIMDTKDNFRVWGDYLINREYDDILVDEGICDNLDKLCWLHFSDCMNNGGTSQLFIDFSPSAKGKKGQVVRYLHDSDELVIVADSFDGYLQMLMDCEYDFITEDIAEE